MQGYAGKKWRCAGTKLVLDKEIWWDTVYVEVPEFRMTKGYLNYLKAKREQELKDRIMCLKEKLEHQLKTYGEIDELDFQELQALMKQATK